MIYLHSKNNNILGNIGHTRPFISKVTTNSNLPVPLRASHTLRWNGSTDALPQGFGLILLSSDTALDGNEAGRLMNVLRLAPELDYLTDHDVIKFQPTNCGINVLYRHEANWGNTSSRVTSRHFKLSNWSLLNTDGPEWLFSMHHESLLTVPCSHFEVQKLLKVQS
jgi:hypothetical protein